MKPILKQFHDKINNGEYVYGVFMKTSDPMFVEICGIAGYDYVILDTEHGPTDIEHQQNNVRACDARGMASIIRVPYIDDNTIGKALDIGASGIQVSQVRTAEDAIRVVNYAKFFPYGERGVCRFVRAADYSALPRNKYFEESKDNVIILQIEGQLAINNLDEILAIDGYEILFIGPYDLSQSLGIPGDVTNPKVLDEMEKIVKKAKSKGKIIGTFTDNDAMVAKWKSLGVQYISYSTDAGLFYDVASDRLDKLKKL